MSTGVEFEEDSFNSSPSQVRSGTAPTYQSKQTSYSSNEEKGFSGWLISHHLAKTAQGAQMILLGIVLFNIIITVTLLIYFL